MPSGHATSADISNLPAIQAAIYDIALNHANLTWWGSVNGDYPRGIAVQGFPYLAVTNGVQVGSIGPDGRFTSGLARLPGTSEPVWEFTVLGLWPFHPADARTYTTVQDALTKLLQAFTIYWTPEQQAQALVINDAVTTDLQLKTGHKFSAVRLSVRVTEQLLVDYQ